MYKYKLMQICNWITHRPMYHQSDQHFFPSFFLLFFSKLVQTIQYFFPDPLVYLLLHWLLNILHIRKFSYQSSFVLKLELVHLFILVVELSGKARSHISISTNDNKWGNFRTSGILVSITLEEINRFRSQCSSS